MVATVRLDSNIEEKLELLSTTLHKKKSEIIREAISYYANAVQDSKKSRILNAVEKTKNSDKSLHTEFEGTLNDGI